MQQVREAFAKNGHLHHAYIIEGDAEKVYDDLCRFCDEDLQHHTKANQDFLYNRYDVFTVDNARVLREMQLNKTRDGSRKVFIVSFNFITIQAQNALLKVLEEPTTGTHIFILTPSAHIFLPTVLSRVLIIRGEQVSHHISAKAFLESSVKERMEYVTNLVKEIKDEKQSKAAAIQLVRGLSIALHEQAKTPQDFKTLRELESVTAYLQDASASVKMLLEHTALVV